MRRAAAHDHEPPGFHRLGIALTILAVVGCASKNSASPQASHAVGAEECCDESWSFIVPRYVEARTCVPREHVETLVRRGELQPISVGAGSREPDPSALYLRVEIVQDKFGFKTRYDAVRREGSPGYGNAPSRGFVTVERVYEEKMLPAAMSLCEPAAAGCRVGDDVRRAWCTDMELEPGLQALRIVAPGVPPIELRPPEPRPEIEAYFADSPDGRLLVQLRADAGPFATATLRVGLLGDSPLYRVPIARKHERDCFLDLRGTSHFKQPVSASVITPLSWQVLAAEVPLPKTLNERARFGPVQKIDFDFLLAAHRAWFDPRAIEPAKFERGDWRSMRASRGECPEHPATPARAVLDGVDLVGLDLRNIKLQRASLRDAGLADADMNKSDLCGADLSDADMRRAQALTIRLQDATLDRVDAQRSDLWGNMERSRWRGADLREANLGGSLVGADFTSADLRGARVYGDLARASFQEARLNGVRFAGTDLRSAVGLTQAMLDAACAEAGTSPPADLHIKACE